MSWNEKRKDLWYNKEKDKSINITTDSSNDFFVSTFKMNKRGYSSGMPISSERFSSYHAAKKRSFDLMKR